MELRPVNNMFIHTLTKVFFFSELQKVPSVHICACVRARVCVREMFVFWYLPQTEHRTPKYRKMTPNSWLLKWCASMAVEV